MFSLYILPLPSLPVQADIKIRACWGFVAGKHIFWGEKEGVGGRRKQGSWSPQFRPVRTCSLLCELPWGWCGASGEVDGGNSKMLLPPQASLGSCPAELTPWPGAAWHQEDGGTAAAPDLTIRSPGPAQTPWRGWWGSPYSESLSPPAWGQKGLSDDVNLIDRQETTLTL